MRRMTYIRKLDGATARIRVAGDGQFAIFIITTTYGEHACYTRSEVAYWLKHMGYEPDEDSERGTRCKQSSAKSAGV